MAAAERQEVKAVAKWVHTSPRKARLVVEHIRGRTVPEARTVLAFTQRAAARDVAKVLSSAVANAEANHNLVGDDLVVAAAYVDEGPVLKRWRARARGRAARIQKPTCHITIKLVPVEPALQAKAPPAEDTAEAGTKKKPAETKAEAPKKKAAPKRKTPAKKKEAAA
jgi:large subunit ribosomal protein L22